MSQRKVGENFAGLQSYILSEIDSGGEECKQNYLSDASSFSNASSSESKNDNSSLSNESEGEQEDIIHELLTGSTSFLPK